MLLRGAGSSGPRLVPSVVWLNNPVTDDATTPSPSADSTAAEASAETSAETGAGKPRRRVVRWVVLGLVAVVVLLLLAVAWVGVRALLAKGELEAAIPLVSGLQDDVASGDLAAAQATVTEVSAHTSNAHALTSDPIWRLAEGLPVAGPNLTGFRELADITDDLVQGVIVPVARLGDTIDPAALKPVDGRIDLAPFAEASAVVDSAKGQLEASLARVQALDTSRAVSQIQTARTQLEDMLGPLLPMLDQAADLVDLAPVLLGADGPRDYLIVFQGNAEARALGGQTGSWVQVTADDGAIELVRQESIAVLRNETAVIGLTEGQLALWPGAGYDPSNATMVPRLDLSAQTAAAFWKNRFGVDPDAVLFIDPVAIGYLLEGMGPVELASGDTIDADTAAEFLLNGIYLKYNVGTEQEVNASQEVVFESFATEFFGALMRGDFDPATVATSAIASGKEHRLLAWFFDEGEREQLGFLPFGLETPALDDTTVGFGVYITDNLGSKMTYYLDAKVELGQRVCAGAGNYEVRVTLTNTVPPGEGASIPDYIGRSEGGNFRILTTVYAPPGSTFVGASGWDATFTPVTASDGEYPAMVQRLVLTPGQTVTGTFVVSSADVRPERTLEAYVTPLARPVPVTTFDYAC